MRNVEMQYMTLLWYRNDVIVYKDGGNCKLWHCSNYHLNVKTRRLQKLRNKKEFKTD